MYDIKFNLIGTTYALTGVVITSFYQVVNLSFFQNSSSSCSINLFPNSVGRREAKWDDSQFNATFILPSSNISHLTDFTCSGMRTCYSTYLSIMDFNRIGKTLYIVQVNVVHLLWLHYLIVGRFVFLSGRLCCKSFDLLDHWQHVCTDVSFFFINRS